LIKLRLPGTTFIITIVAFLALIFAADTLISFHVGTQSDSGSAAKTLASQKLPSADRATPKTSSTYGPNVNFGSFTLVGTVETATNNGVVVQTAGGNVMSILFDQSSVIVNPSGKKLTATTLEKGNTVSIIARVNVGGQFVALRVIQE
jgi:hypothetical protein